MGVYFEMYFHVSFFGSDILQSDLLLLIRTSLDWLIIFDFCLFLKDYIPAPDYYAVIIFCRNLERFDDVIRSEDFVDWRRVVRFFGMHNWQLPYTY